MSKRDAAGLASLALAVLGLALGGCVRLDLDRGGIGFKLGFQDEGKAKPQAQPQPPAEPQPQPRPQPGGIASCDLRIIQVSDGSVVASATGEAARGRLADLAKALARKLKEGMLVKDASLAVVSLRNRSGTPNGKVVADEVADKVTGALVETGWFDVKERIDLRGILNEKDLESSDMVKNPQVQPRLAAIRYVVMGGVTATEASRSE